MSIRVSSLVWDNGPCATADRFLLLALADNADDNGQAWPGLELLAEKCCVTAKTASATVKRLERDGWLTVIRGRGRGRSNQYQINLSKLRENEPLKPSVDDRATEPLKPPMEVPKTPRGRSKTPRPQPEEPSVEPSVEPSLGAADATQQQTGSGDRPIEGVLFAVPDPVESRRPVKRATQLPETWRPNDGHLAFVREHGIDGALELAQFRDHHIAKGSTMKDWDAAFRTWLRNAVKFSRPAGARGTDAENEWMRRRPAR